MQNIMKLRRGTRPAVAMIVLLALLSLCTISLFGQSLVSGDLAGTVKDSTGAVLPKATVVLKDKGNGQVRSAVTNQAGNYRFPLLQPGTYVVTVTAAGFSPSTKSVTVAVGQAPELDFAMSVGGTVAIVEVTDQAALLQTENANQATSYSQSQVDLLPNGGGDLTQIAQFAPGSVMSTGGGYGNFTSNGLPANTNVFTVNGTNNMDPYFNINNSGATNLTLGSSEISEAVVIGNAFSAEYGQQAGAQVNYVTKSGTNTLHGTLKWNWTGRSLSARDYFNTKDQAQPFTNNNQYAATIGGPIKKDKTYFFASTEGLRYILATSAQTYIPSTDYQNAVLNYIGANTPGQLNAYKQAFGYYNNAAGASTAVVDPNDPCDSFTQSMIGLTDAQAANCTKTWRSTPGQLSKEWLASFRVDQNLGQNDRVYLRFHTDHGLQATYTDSLSPNFNATSPQPSYGGQAEFTHVFHNGSTNQAIFSSDFYSASFQPVAKGMSDFPYSLLFLDMPWANVGGEQYSFPQGRDVHQYQFLDDFSTRLGNHTLKFGVNYRKYAIDDYIFEARNKSVIAEFYNESFAVGNTSFFLQRFPNKLNQNIGINGIGVYAEDEWKISPKWKVIYGVRLEHNSNPTCADDCFADTIAPWGQSAHDSTVAYDQFIKTGQHNAFRAVDNLVIGPRLGITYSPLASNKTVIRGGFGVFYDASPADLVDNMARNFPNYGSYNDQSGFYYWDYYGCTVPATQSCAGYVPVGWAKGAAMPTGWSNGWSALAATDAALKNGFTKNQTYATIKAAVPAGAFSAPSLTSMPGTYKTPTYQKWSLELQQAITKNDAINIAYTGNRGSNVAMPNGMANAYTSRNIAPFPTSALDPRLGAVTVYASNGYSNYNGLTTTFTHRMSQGMQFAVNYTWSKALDTISSSGGAAAPYGGASITNVLNPSNLRQNYSYADYDVRHYISANALWQPKFDKWLHAPKIIGADWDISSTMFYKSGMPFTVTNSGSAYSLSLGAPSSLLPIYTGAAYSCSSSAVTTACLDSTQFKVPTTATGISPATRNMFRGPKYFDMDMAINKGFRAGEKAKLVLGATAYNLLNHPNFDFPCSNAGTCGGSFGNILNALSAPTSPYGSFTGSSASARILQLNVKVEF